MDRKSFSFFVVGIITGLLISVGCFTLYVRNQGDTVSDSGKIILKLGHGLDPAHPVHKAMLFMAERLKEKSRPFCFFAIR